MVSSTVRKVQYAKGAGWTGDYSITFPYWAKAEIIAVLSYDDGVTADVTLVLDTDYTLTAAGATGTLTVLSVWDTLAVRLTIYRQLTIEQDTDYRDGEAVPADTIETDFDRAVARDQELDEKLNRGLRAPVTDDDATLDMELPSAEERKGMLLGFDDTTGNPVVAVEASKVSTFMRTVLADEDAVEANASLVSIKTLTDESYIVLDDDGYTHIILSATVLTADRTITLPTAADNANRRIRIATRNAHTTYTLTVDGEGAETINGTLVVTLHGVNQYLQLLCTGTEWIIEAIEHYRETSDTSAYTESAATHDTYYSPGPVTIALEPGKYILGLHCRAEFYYGSLLSNAYLIVGLATSSGGTPTPETLAYTRQHEYDGTVWMPYQCSVIVPNLVVAAATTYYISALQGNASNVAADLKLTGDAAHPTRIWAKRIG